MGPAYAGQNGQTVFSFFAGKKRKNENSKLVKIQFSVFSFFGQPQENPLWAILSQISPALFPSIAMDVLLEDPDVLHDDPG